MTACAGSLGSPPLGAFGHSHQRAGVNVLESAVPHAARAATGVRPMPAVLAAERRWN